MKIFLDVGAHIGQTLEVALEKKYSFGKIYCFEPVRQYWGVLKKNQDDRIVICEYGLWNENCTKKIYAPKSMGASLFDDKFNGAVESQNIKLVSASNWFRQYLKKDDQVYLKLNCEGAECAILDDLIKSNEYQKIDVLMVDFDVRKIPSQKHLVDEMKAKVLKLGIPQVFYIDKNPRRKLTPADFTRYWLENSGSSFSNLGKSMSTLSFIANTLRLDLSTDSQIEIPTAGRNNLAGWLHDLDFKVGVEVGVAAGEYSEVLCQTNPQMKLHGIDPWTPHKGYRDYTRTKTFEKLYADATTHLTKYPAYKFIKEFSKDALKRFANNSLDFVYIDANHTEPYISQDILGWNQKIRSGGIVAGHDYTSQVKNAVDKFVSDNNINPLFVLQSVEIPTWMWIKT